jgi:hypothetical protein
MSSSSWSSGGRRPREPTGPNLISQQERLKSRWRSRISEAPAGCAVRQPEEQPNHNDGPKLEDYRRVLDHGNRPIYRVAGLIREARTSEANQDKADEEQQDEDEKREAAAQALDAHCHKGE